MDTVNLDKLLGEKLPVMAFELGGRTYPVYAYEDLTVGVTARLSEVNAEFETINEQVREETDRIEVELKSLMAKENQDVSAKRNSLNATRIAQQSRLLKPMQDLVETIADMPKGALSSISAVALNRLFAQVNEKVFSSLGKQEDAIEEEAKEIPEETQESTPKP
jgi:DNA anti-recombination protein RmuC